ncbi:MAG: hypothetical protein K0B08_07560 [Bacteroidales bacterium]|nr:hypothetical protein [Bacteroidales bacterium]
MAEFNYNDGDPVSIPVSPADRKKMIYLSSGVIPEMDLIKIAGYALIDLIYAVKDLIFEDHPLNKADQLFDRTIGVRVDATKFKTTTSHSDGSSIPITSKLTIKADNEMLAEFIMDDASHPTANSVFYFRFILIPSEDE